MYVNEDEILLVVLENYNIVYLKSHYVFNSDEKYWRLGATNLLDYSNTLKINNDIFFISNEGNIDKKSNIIYNGD